MECERCNVHSATAMVANSRRNQPSRRPATACGRSQSRELPVKRPCFISLADGLRVPEVKHGDRLHHPYYHSCKCWLNFFLLFEMGWIFFK